MKSLQGHKFTSIIPISAILGAGMLILTLFSCTEFSSKNSVENARHFIYLAHTRIKTNDSIYSKIYDIDFSQFDMTLLGGDLSWHSFRGDFILEHMDSLFDFKNPNTLWSIGNHDRTSNKQFYKATLKNKYHAYQNYDVTFITLDSQDSLSSIVGAQKDFLFNVLDTLQTKNVVILSHKLIFMNDHPVMDAMISKICNGKKGDCYHCHNTNNFYQDIYPKLRALRNNDVQVFWIGGDLGYRTSEFEYIDENGIRFLGNGFWYPRTHNKVLLFSKKEYTFVPIDFLLKYQKKNLDSLYFRQDL